MFSVHLFDLRGVYVENDPFFHLLRRSQHAVLLGEPLVEHGVLLYLLEDYRSGKDSKEAVESTKGWVVGWGTAAIVRLGMAGVMVVLWLGVVFLL